MVFRAVVGVGWPRILKGVHLDIVRSACSRWAEEWESSFLAANRTPVDNQDSPLELCSLDSGYGKVHVGVIVRTRKRLIVSGRFEQQAYNAASGRSPMCSVRCKEQSVLYVRVLMDPLGSTVVCRNN